MSLRSKIPTCSSAFLMADSRSNSDSDSNSGSDRFSDVMSEPDSTTVNDKPDTSTSKFFFSGQLTYILSRSDNIILYMVVITCLGLLIEKSRTNFNKFDIPIPILLLVLLIASKSDKALYKCLLMLGIFIYTLVIWNINFNKDKEDKKAIKENNMLLGIWIASGVGTILCLLLNKFENKDTKDLTYFRFIPTLG